MDKNAIKKFAVWARTELISRVMQKALLFGIEEKRTAPANNVIVDGKPLTAAQQTQRKALIYEINQKGYQHVMEDVAYTWFNRFIALRFMEVNGYLPSRVRVFTDENGKFNPQIIDEAIHLDLDGLDMEKVYAYKEANQTGALYRYLLTTQCNALSKLLPRMFQPIQDYTELLLPDNLLREGSVIEQMVTLIPEEDWQDQVQIIGWLYQYYNTEPKDKVFADLKKNIKISKEKIPAATQLFTPDWIVRYMVENSLGRLWLEGHPNETLKAGWKYYLDEAEQEPAVQEQLAKIRAGYAAIKPEDIRVIDPCMGSGHILVYMFDVLVQIYEDYGYTTREAVESIIQHNLYGLDIDDRAAQLAYFAVMMKARQYDRRFLSRKDEDGTPNIPQPHVYAIVESNGIDRSVIRQLGAGMPGIEYNSAVTQMNALLDALHDAKEYGSILTVDELDWALLRRFVAAGANHAQLSMDTLGLDEAMARLPGLIDVGEALGQKYDAVVTNPPYMGLSGMNTKLCDYVKNAYPISKMDLFSCFIERGLEMTKMNRFFASITMESWMFLSSFEKLRYQLLKCDVLHSMVHMPYLGKGKTSMGINFGTVATIMLKQSLSGYKGKYDYICHYDIDDDGVPLQFPIINERYLSKDQSKYELIPGAPISYWVSDNVYRAFQNYSLEKYSISDGQNVTSNNDRFVRFHWEVLRSSIGQAKKWRLYSKGGDFRRWYGNLLNIVDWSPDAIYFYHKESSARVIPEYLWYREGITWGLITSATTSFRYLPKDATFDKAGSSIFISDDHLYYYLALLNSAVVEKFLKILNSTISLQVKDVRAIPVLYTDIEHVEAVVEDCIRISTTDWDAFEISWDFQQHPLIRCASFSMQEMAEDAKHHIRDMNYLEDAYTRWSNECFLRFQQLKANEEELNRIFIDIYGLQDELTPDVDEKDVTVRRADLGRDIRSLISYAVGVMFGRYSLDVPGLAYAGGAWDASKYTTIIPDKDGILPICDDEYFEDDIVGRFVRFIEVVYGKDTLEQNLAFIASALGGKGTPREVIRSYFLNDFYKDHLRIYQKRPIYWLFDSGKKNGFKCLIYMHRYAPDTIARIRTDYVHEQQSRYRTALSTLEGQIAGASGSERVRLTKQQQKLQAQAEEIRLYEEKIHHLADQMIAIDLDDGVKHNYEIFRAVLAPIK